MKYRLTTQHNKSDSEQNVTITECKEAVKQTYQLQCWQRLRNVLNRKMHQFMKEIRKLTSGCVYQM